MNILAALPSEDKKKLNKKLHHLLPVLLLGTILTTSFLGQSASGQVLPVGQNNTNTLFTSAFSFQPLKDPVVDSYVPLVSGYFSNDPTRRGSFILDTGASYSLVTDATALKLGLVTLPAFRDGKRVYVGGVALDSVTLPSFKISTDSLFDPPIDANGLFAAVPEKIMLSLFGTPVSGVLGDDHWSKLGLVFDFPKHRATAFLPTELDQDKLQKLGFGRATLIPLTLDKDGVPIVTVHLHQGSQDAEEKMNVDTGSSTTQVSNQTATVLGLKPIRQGVGTGGIAGSYKTSEATLDTLRVGDQTLRNVTIAYASSGKGLSAPVLGMDILQHYKMLLSISDKKMYLLPAQTAPVAPASPAPKPPAK